MYHLPVLRGPASSVSFENDGAIRCDALHAGLMLCAKTPAARAGLSALFARSSSNGECS